MVKIKKTTVKILTVLLIIGLFLFWFVGWESYNTDLNDKEVGKKITFHVPMVLITNMSANMLEEYLSENYNGALRTTKSWKANTAWFQKAHVQTISCDETFIVEEAVNLKQHGFLGRAFKSNNKWYVLSSTNYKKFVIPQWSYEEHAKIFTTANNSCISSTE